MQGGYAEIYRACDSVRGVLDRRLEVMILGMDANPKPKASAAFRALRTGNIHRLRWFHLVDMPDKGTAEKPLLSLQQMGGDGAKYAMARATARAASIISLSFPEWWPQRRCSSQHWWLSSVSTWTWAWRGQL